MALLPSLFKFFRYLRSIIVPLAAIASLCFFLSIFLVLYQPVTGPDHIQRVGWQAWSLIAPPGSVQVPVTSGTSATVPAGVDWWNVSTPETATVDTATLPLDVWNPLLPHDTGLSEVAVVSCVIPPSMSFGTMCKPHTTVEHDAIKGKWVRVEGNLNIQSGIYFLHVWYRRTRRLDVPLITDLRILPPGQEPTPASQYWQKASTSLREGVLHSPPMFLWFYAERTRMEMSAREQKSLVTEIDILYGEDVPWYGFQGLDPPTTEEQVGKIEKVTLLYRKGVQPVPRAPPLHFSHDGRFKIMQVADLHFSVGRGACRDTVLSPCDSADNITTTLIGRALDAEKPDLVVFTGDQLNGQKTSWDARSVLAKFSRAAADRGIPWAVVFGNHDDEDGAGRAEQLRMMQQLPYALVERGPTDVHGVGNYVLKVKSADPSKTHLLTLYFLDSGSYSKGYMDWLGIHPTAYDWIRDSQTNWFLQESSSIGLLERPFTPDGAKDLGDVWARDPQAIGGQIPSQKTRLAKPNAMMFFHIPLPESYSKADADPKTGKPLNVGVQLDQQGSAKGSDGFFEKGLLQALESQHSALGNAREVKVVTNGHCHNSDNCRRVRGIWTCFGGGGSYAGYGKIGFDRRFRMYDIADYGETIATYKRTEQDEIVDRMVLAGKGAPVPYEGT